MKKIISFVLVMVMVLGLSSCLFPNPPICTDPPITDQPTKPSTTKPSGTTQKKEPIKPSDDIVIPEDEQEQLFADLFDYNNHIYFKLDISNEELAKIQKDYESYSSWGSKSPIYRMANLYVKITYPDGSSKDWYVEQVGVRMKGNTSRTSFYSEEEGMHSLIHFKLDFGETFDDEEYYGDEIVLWENDEQREARKDRTFATLEKIDIRWNRNSDTTYVRESYQYDIFRELGLLAPHTNLTSFDIGEDHAGVWLINEPIDDIFIEKNLPKEACGGDLYKLGWTNEGATFTKFSSYGVEDEDKGAFFVYDLKTNKKKSTHESLKNLIETLNLRSLNKESFSEVVDVDSFVAWSAISYFIGNPDDLRNNYNNCYIYFLKDSGKMVIIPYDTDRGLGVNTWNPYGDGMTTDSPFSMVTAGGGSQKSPLFANTISGTGFLVDEYIAKLEELANHRVFSVEALKERYDLAKKLYEDDAATSKQYYNAEYCDFRFDFDKTCNPGDSSNMSYKDYITIKKQTLETALKNYKENPPIPEEKRSKIFIRGDFNGWSDHAEYELTHIEGSIYSIVITRSSKFEFKVYDSVSREWYESVSPDCKVEYGVSSSHSNIMLGAGTYKITFDLSTGIINIE